MGTECFYAATIGVFDGVHRGHCYLIDQLKREAARRRLPTMVITFDRHPRQVLCPDWQPQLLTTTAEKEALLLQTGIDRVVMLRFDADMAQLTARRFMEQVLCGQLGVRLLLTGYDNHFGHQEPGRPRDQFADYVAYGRELGMEVAGALPLARGDVRFSSSMVRRLLAGGDVDGARRCLNRCYAVSGHVVSGEQIGRRLGFPTANLLPDDCCKLIPKEGVYVVRVTVDGDPLPHRRGIMNIGRRPTFNGHHTTLEVHILDFSGNLYGKSVRVEFVSRLRDERPFFSPEALVRQIEEDRAQAEKLLNSQKND